MSMFGKKKELFPIKQVRDIMRHFVEASYIGLNNTRMQTPEHGKMCLTYMFGAVDMICQVNQFDSAKAVALFQELLKDILGDYSPEEAKQLTQIILKASGTPDGQRIMREGGESLRMWISGVTLAPHRLQELLLEISSRQTHMGDS